MESMPALNRRNGKLKKVKIVSEIFQGLDDIKVHHLTVTDSRYYVDELP